MKTNAERQAQYRQRHLKNEDSKRERLNLLIDFHAKRMLERLAACYGVTQRTLLEQLLTKAEQSVLEHIAQRPQGYTDYYERRLRIEEHDVDVTQ